MGKKRESTQIINIENSSVNITIHPAAIKRKTIDYYNFMPTH